tara:strand:+ start:4289 stop:4930 length:642 start_codon:yes stop_codon:yes gene_type:complete
MENVLKNFTTIKQEISDKKNVKLVAVTKTFTINHILPVINEGHIDFGENKVQEAIEKWTSIKQDFPKIKLHLIGKLQTNKVKFVLPLFDYIHSLDSLKLASKISEQQSIKNFKPKLFIQVNVGNEPQKSGVDIDSIKNFYKKCVEDFKLDIIGLMCIPPFDKDPKPYFTKMKELSNNLNLKDISMGMSNDYMQAINQGSTFIRVGSKIFGARD